MKVTTTAEQLEAARAALALADHAIHQARFRQLRADEEQFQAEAMAYLSYRPENEDAEDDSDHGACREVIVKALSLIQLATPLWRDVPLSQDPVFCLDNLNDD